MYSDHYCFASAVSSDRGSKSISLREQKAELKVQAAEISAQIEEAQDEHKKLEEKEEYMKTKKYVEEVARNQLGLVYPDEIVIRPKE